MFGCIYLTFLGYILQLEPAPYVENILFIYVSFIICI